MFRKVTSILKYFLIDILLNTLFSISFVFFFLFLLNTLFFFLQSCNLVKKKKKQFLGANLERLEYLVEGPQKGNTELGLAQLTQFN